MKLKSLPYCIALALSVNSLSAFAEGKSVEGGDDSSPAPIHIIEREDIDRSAYVSLEDLLQRLPISGSALNSRFNGGATGRSHVNLRNLGSDSTLVLINGRRVVTQSDGVVDLSMIGLSSVERIEILPATAAVLYGSGAVAGVINIVTRKDFEGIQASAYIGQFESEGDGEVQSYDFSVGASSDRGSVFFNVDYFQHEDVSAGDRAISAEPQFGTGLAFASTATPQGRFGSAVLGSFSLSTDPGTNITGPGGLGAAAFRELDFTFGFPESSTSDRYNFAPSGLIQTPRERTHISTIAAYELTDDIVLDVQASYANRESEQRLAPTALFLGLFGSGVGAQTGVSAENPFNPFGVDLLPSSSLIARRLVEAGPRQFTQDVDEFRFVLGLSGAIELGEKSFDWDVAYNYGKSRQSDRDFGLVNMARVRDALSAECIQGAIADCVPLNIFGGQGPDGQGTITQEMLDYILFVQQDQFGADLRNYQANIQGDVAELPAGPLHLSAGFEYREESSQSRMRWSPPEVPEVRRSHRLLVM